ncbi:MAG: CPBP family intramembrane glutamic endopeptidase [Cyclobacteriaceae bacterium]|nr:CPBP family intramembrane glutamic endopeptidase [Cyclobacteriaceae bacterium]
MNTTLLLLTTGFAMFGFLSWYALSATLRHQKSFQIQFDICTPYVNRFYRRRIMLFILYTILPFLAIFRWQWAGPISPEALGISFAWTPSALYWVMGSLVVAFAYNLLYAGRDFNLTEFPEIRITRWSPGILSLSALTKALQVFSIEYMFRGLVLGSLLYAGYSDLASIILSAGLYALTNYYKTNRYALFSVIYGLMAAYIAIQTGSLLSVLIIHLAFSLINEWFSIRRHPEMKTV